MNDVGVGDAVHCSPDDWPQSGEQEPWKLEIAQYGNGSLRNAVLAFKRTHPLENVRLIGSLGIGADEMTSTTVASIKTSLEHVHNASLVLIQPEMLDKHYAHYCQRLAWPILNSQIPDCPRNHVYDESFWEEYVRVNQAFADEIMAKWHPGDFVWIHDYHLALTPGLMRQKLPNSVIGFFFHSSFPPSEVFRCLAERERFLAGVLGADIVGFQTDEHRLHFVRSCRRLLSVDVSAHTVHFEGRVIRTRTFPIGIDIARLLDTFQNQITGEWIKSLQQEYFGKSLVIGRDRLDGVTGVKQKLLIYEHFLDSYPEWVGKVSEESAVFVICSCLTWL